MKSVILPSSLLLSPSTSPEFRPYLHIQSQHICSNYHHKYHQLHSPFSLAFPHHSSRAQKSSIRAANIPIPSDEGAVSVISFEDFVEKDWSFLDSDGRTSDRDYNHKLDRIIASGVIDESSRVMVCTGSEGFVDKVVESSPCNLLLVVHDSLLVLACIKEKYDNVKCWQGELIYVPEKWAPLDVVFLYFLPALPFELDQMFEALTKLCSPGARVVISHPQGREVLEKQRQQYRDAIVSELPERLTLEKVAAQHSFELVEFVDDPGFYLGVMKLHKPTD